MSDLNQHAELCDVTVSPSAADEINNSSVFEDRELPGGVNEHSEIASKQHMIESDHDDVAVHVVDKIQSEGEKEENYLSTIKEIFI